LPLAELSWPVGPNRDGLNPDLRIPVRLQLFDFLPTK
jgi:hypothetical protein